MRSSKYLGQSESSRVRRSVALWMLVAGLQSPSIAQCPPQGGVKLTASDGHAGTAFGVALSLSGDRVAVTAGQRHGYIPGGDAVYLFDRSGPTWSETVKLVPAEFEADDSFGASLSLVGDRIAIGALGDDDLGADAGAVYIYEWSGASWVRTAKLFAPDPAPAAYFGWAVALDGNRLLVGAPGDVEAGLNCGSAYVFEFDGSTWTSNQHWTASDAAVDGGFGRAVALQGERAVVTSAESRGIAPIYVPTPGGAYVFDRSGTSWSETVKLLTTHPEYIGANFGVSVALDGDRVLVGANDDFESGPDTGSASIYQVSGATWSLRVKLTPMWGNTFQRFGQSLAISGSTAVVGAGGFLNARGRVYPFHDDGGTWVRTGDVAAPAQTAGARFGEVLALQGDRLIVGEPYEDSQGTDAGCAWVYQFSSAPPPGVAFCSGDGSLPTVCPCALPSSVPNPPAAVGHGCANPLNSAGAALMACGTTAPDKLRLIAGVAQKHAAFALLVKSDAADFNGFAAHDGISCLSGALIRFGGHQPGDAVFTGDHVGTWSYPNAVMTTAISVATAQPAGQTAYYQLVYRSAIAGFCNPATLNWSNAYQVTWP